MPMRSRSNRTRSSAPAGAAKRRSVRGWLIDATIAAGLALLVAVAYAQVVRFEFVNYDDTVYVPDNPHVRSGFSLEGVGWAFTTFETANWYPLSWLSLMLDCQVFGRNQPGGHHAVNAVLHAANAILLLIVLRKMTGLRWRSAVVAALFAVHPLHVESVAWIAERKDVLSTLLFLLTLLAYGRYAARPNLGRWLAVFSLMALGLLAKSMLVTLPAVLLLMDFWPGQRAEGQPEDARQGAAPRAARGSFAWLIAEKLPLVLLSVAIAVVTVCAQMSKGATLMLDDRATLTIRLANAALAYVKYLGMFVWPFDLAVYYPYNFHPSPWTAAGAALLVLALTTAAVWCLRQGRFVPLAAGWLWYVFSLVPVIGLVQVGSQAMADRYTYIPSIGISLAIVWAMTDLTRGLLHSPERRRVVLAAAASVIIAVLLVAAHRQAGYWINSEQLFRHALAITEDNPVACENLGDSLLHQRRFAEAEVQFRMVLKMDARHFQKDTPEELARALDGQGRIADIVTVLQETIPDNSVRALTMNNLALILAPKGLVPLAIRLLQEAIRLAPQEPTAMKNLAWIYATCPDRRFRDGFQAVELARRACELSQWKNAACRRTLADAYLEAGDPEHAIQELRAVIESGSADGATAQQLESLLQKGGKATAARPE
jgi:protein O-mannosyl-transferase